MRSRSLIASLVLCCLALGLMACPPYRSAKPKEEAPDVRMKTMAVDETRFFSFWPDGEWHNSGILVMAGDSFEVEPLGLSAGLEAGDLQYRASMDGWPLYVAGEQPVEFEHMGPMLFKAPCMDKELMPEMVQVRVTKISGPLAGQKK